jgi:hypothetical protein
MPSLSQAHFDPEVERPPSTISYQVVLQHPPQGLIILKNLFCLAVRYHLVVQQGAIVPWQWEFLRLLQGKLSLTCGCTKLTPTSQQ